MEKVIISNISGKVAMTFENIKNVKSWWLASTTRFL